MEKRRDQSAACTLGCKDVAMTRICQRAALFVRLGHSYLDHASAIGIFAYMMAFILGGLLWLAVWARFIPSDVSWWVGGFVWVIALWLAFTNRLI